MPETTRRTYPGLDTVRALAALAVLATHTSFWAGFYPQGLLGAMTARLDIGVAIFFVLSGFLLGQPFLAAMADGTASPRAGRYLWKRFLRIVPLYVVTVVVALLALPENDGAGPGTWIRQLTLTQVYPPSDLVAGLTHMWSLCVEVAFYLALPLLLWPLHRWSARRGWNPRTVLLVLAGAGLASWCWLGLVAPRVDGSNLWLPAFLGWFAVGLALAVVDLERRAAPRFAGLAGLAGQPGVCWTLAAAAFAVSATPLAGPTLLEQPTAGQAVVKSVLYAVAAGLVVLPSVLGPADTRYARAMAWGPLRHLGHISYGIFCLHLLVVHGVAAALDLPLYQGNGWTLFGLTVLGSVVAAEIAYRLVERPAMRLKDRGRGTTAPTSAPSASSTRS